MYQGDLQAGLDRECLECVFYRRIENDKSRNGQTECWRYSGSKNI